MGGHRAERLRIECPICHEEFDRDIEDHLLTDHTKEQLARQILADLAANEYDMFW